MLVIDFILPKELIAQEPARPRDHARLLVYDRATKQITDEYFYNLLTYLPEPTTVVVNNSKVDHCRYLFNGGKREIFVIEAVNDKTVQVLVRPGKQFKLGATVQLSESVSVNVTNIDEDGIRTLVFSETLDHADLVAARHVPLPPYIAQNDELAEEYQTIYAKTNGSKAAPTAGLHFTNELRTKIQSERDWEEITLHVGLGTFASLTDEQLDSGKLHEEHFEISGPALKHIFNAKHVTAVGTTSTRTLESIFKDSNNLQGLSLQKGLEGSTDILIKPGFEFKRVDSLITNFHLPGTSLLLLVEAFVGSEIEMQKIYDHAIEKKYRFYSFGDAMLII
ncbi:tRNA preQ1(34) S-adenosylmethionine ribosyltransferase-isomerase QueA [Candidatus Saccharibacteria bacterium]|nr:tRNA preQ1(34) S-adenosylmethionine ribosyltransferase-isomerase QueA [Candidatus Saccharibacteria bacterium]